MRTSLKQRFGKAFTLIELLIVITIIGILAVALIPRVTQGPAKARDVKRKSDVQNIGTSLELYYSDLASYPAGAGGCAETDLTTPLSDYTQAIPTDPNSSNDTLGCTGGYYYQNLNGSSFAVVTKLEGTVTGDNIYCNVVADDISTDYATTLASLATRTCVAPEDDVLYYVILR